MQNLRETHRHIAQIAVYQLQRTDADAKKEGGFRQLEQADGKQPPIVVRVFRRHIGVRWVFLYRAFAHIPTTLS